MRKGVDIVDHSARQELIVCLRRCREEYESSGNALEVFKNLPESSDRAIRGIANEITDELDDLRMPLRANPPEDVIPPEIARAMDRALIFLETDQPYIHDRWGWKSTALLGCFLTGLVLLCAGASIAEIRGTESSWLMVIGLVLAGPVLGMMMLAAILQHVAAFCIIIAVRVFRRDLTEYEEDDDEHWPFADRAAWEAARDMAD